jgi:hypothetical protein
VILSVAVNVGLLELIFDKLVEGVHVIVSIVDKIALSVTSVPSKIVSLGAA